MKKTVLALLSAVALLAGLSGAAVAAPSPETYEVVAMGDSYASGFGAGDYQPGTEGNCSRSRNSYGELAAQDLAARGRLVNFINVTCSGAKISDLSSEFNGQPPQINALKGNTSLVLLGIGGNDMGFVEYAGACLASSCEGGPTLTALATMPTIKQKLNDLFRLIKSKSPQAKIVLVGYGRPMTYGENANVSGLDPVCGPGFFSMAERMAGTLVTSMLDLTLVASVLQATFEGINVHFVSPLMLSAVLHASFQGHLLCEAETPYYTGLASEAPIHLNKDGHWAMFEQLRLAGVLG